MTQNNAVCVANDKGRACHRAADVLMPVALCNVHRIEVALAIVPDMLRNGLAESLADTAPAVSARDDLVETAFATPIEGLLGGVHDSVVYFVANGGRVKIGYTTNLKSRISALALRTDSVLLALPGGAELERALHTRFAEHRNGDTEWFEMSPEIFHYASVRMPATQVVPGQDAAASARREQRKSRAFRVYADLGQPSQRAFIKLWRERGFGESDQTLRELYNEMHEVFEKARKGNSDG